MFSLLNSKIGKGNSSARMRKILNSLSRFFHGRRQRFLWPFYLLEGNRFRSGLFVEVGNRIALLSPRPVLQRIRSGKD